MSLSLSVQMSVCPPKYKSVCLSSHPSRCLFGCYISVYMPKYLLIYLSIHLQYVSGILHVQGSVCLSVQVSVFPGVGLSVQVVVCLFKYLPKCLTVCPIVSLSVHSPVVHLSKCLSICLYGSPSVYLSKCQCLRLPKFLFI